jgi:hypothetical protein
VIDLGRAEKIAKAADPRFYRPPAPIQQIYSKRRIEALSSYMQASGLPCEFSRKPTFHEEHPWICCVPHAITPEGVVYADVQDTREVHRQRVIEVPDDRYWRCQAFLAVTGAPRCDYITIYRMSEEEALAERNKSWGANGRAWKWRKTFYHIHQVKPDQEAIAHLLGQALEIRRKVDEQEKEQGRTSPDPVRAELVPGRRPPGSTRKTYRARRPLEGQ